MAENRSSLEAANEREPLLPRQSQETFGGNQQTIRQRSKRLFQNVIKLFKDAIPRFDVVSPRYRYVPLLGCLIILFNEAEYMCKQVAMVRAIEAMHCIEYYQVHDPDIAHLGKHIPERLCKDDFVQKEVAQTVALQLFFRMFCSMIGNLPLGYIADKKGRRIVLISHKLNVSASCFFQILVYLLYPRLPIWTLYLGGIPGLFGGNFDLGLAMLFASYTDVLVSESQRTTLFFLTTSMQYPAQAIGPLIGGLLMNLDGQGGTPEVALLTGFACAIIAAGLTIFFFPETIQENRNITDADNDQVKDDETRDDVNERTGMRQKFAKKLKSARKSLQRSFQGIGVGSMILLSISILAASVGIKSIDWLSLIQYPIVKFKWQYSQATTVVSAQAVITLLNYAVLLPSYNKISINLLKLSPSRASITIMLFSTLLLIIGAIIIGLSATVVVFFVGLFVYTLGSGLPVATQAYISHMIDKRKLARTLASLSVASVGGKVLATAIFPKVFAAGLDDGREFMKGLPLFVGAALFVVAGVAIAIVGATAKAETSVLHEDADSVNTDEEHGSL